MGGAMKSAKINHVLLVLLVRCIGSYGESVQRRTTLGVVSGRKLNVLKKCVEEYIGIPYAKPPVRDLRFMSPVPMEPWEGTYNANRARTACAQLFTRELMPSGVKYTEDCLYLNVWTSSLQSNEPQKAEHISPVLVWIHGGGFSYGSALHNNYTGSILAAKTGFVVFSMNYRLGALGFIDARTHGAPGNVGLMDQNVALRWIHDNARFFGGDPSKVTIFGESAGAISVHCHLLSPMSRGLFSRAVLLSGSMYGIDVYDSPEESLQKGGRLAELVGCSGKGRNLTTHTEQVLSCLRKISADKILVAALAVVKPKVFPFLPTYHNKFLPREPRASLDSGFFNTMDIIVGVVSDELSTALVSPPNYDFLQESLEGLRQDKIKSTIEGTMGTWVKPALPKALKHYLAGAKDASNRALARQYIDYFSDRLFNCPVRYLQRKHASWGSKVFAYVFDHKYHSPALPSWMGTPHAGELVFLFGLPLVADNDSGNENHALSEAFIKIVASFADSGYPQLPGNKTWPEYSERNPISMVLSPGNYTEVRDYRGTECQYWSKYFELGG